MQAQENKAATPAAAEGEQPEVIAQQETSAEVVAAEQPSAATPEAVEVPDVVAATTQQAEPEIKDQGPATAIANITAQIEALDTTAQPQICEAAAEKAPEVLVASFTAKSGEAEAPNEELEYIEKMRIEGTDIQKRILAAVETFAEQLKPKVPLLPSKAVAYQHEFLQHLLWLLDKSYEDFRGAWNLLLVYFSVYHGNATASNYSALSEFSTNRFLSFWTKGEDRADTYRNLITLLRATRNRATRKHDIKTIALERIGPTVLTSQAIDNLKKFYEL